MHFPPLLFSLNRLTTFLLPEASNLKQNRERASKNSNLGLESSGPKLIVLLKTGVKKSVTVFLSSGLPSVCPVGRSLDVSWGSSPSSHQLHSWEDRLWAASECSGVDSDGQGPRQNQTPGAQNTSCAQPGPPPLGNRGSSDCTAMPLDTTSSGR